MSHRPGDHLADVLDRRHIPVIVLERVVGVRVGRDDPARSGRPNGLRVVVPQRQEQRLLAEPPDIVAAIPLRWRPGCRSSRRYVSRMRAVARPIDWIRSSYDVMLSTKYRVSARTAAVDDTDSCPAPNRPASSPSCRTDCRGSRAPSAACAATAAPCRHRPDLAANRRSCRCIQPAADTRPRTRRRSCRTRSHPRSTTPPTSGMPSFGGPNTG